MSADAARAEESLQEMTQIVREIAAVSHDD
jgi:hypothetical protein